jgi:hypothetical protein
VATNALIVAFWSLPLGRWSTDEAGDYLRFYAPVAKNLLQGHGLVTTSGAVAVEYPPGFPFILVALFWLAQSTGISEALWIQGSTLAALGLASTLLYRLAAMVIGPQRGLVAAALWITCPFHLWLAKQPHSEIVFLPLFYTALLLYVSLLRRGGSRIALACGVFCGFAALVRPIALLFPVVLASGLLLTRSTSWRRWLGRSAFILVGCGLVLLPWEGWARARTGVWIPVSTSGPRAVVDGLTFAVARRDFRAATDTPADVRVLMSDVAERKRRGELRTLGQIIGLLRDKAVEDPTAVSRLFLWKAARAWYGTDAGRSLEIYGLAVQLGYLVISLVGGLLLWRESGLGRAWVLSTVLIVVYFWAMTIIVLSIVRYMTPVMGLLLPGAAVALCRLADAAPRDVPVE